MLSLYVHIPFCVRKCHYCGFYSTLYSKESADNYISALRLEAESYKFAFSSHIFNSVYIGGGTPTVFSFGQLENLIALIRDYFTISTEAEYTVEANPNTLSKQHLTLLKEQGVNRLSLGIQSFSDDLLNFLGRLHTAHEAVDAFELARSVGFNNIGVDLIYGIPGQTVVQWHETLDKVSALKPDHVSAYSLSLDEGSRFWKEADAGRLALPDDDSAVEMYETGVDELGKAGYEQYEISNFSRPGFECRHNLNYWERGQYLGLGPGASSFIENRRYHVIADVNEYIRRLQAGLTVHEDEDIIDPSQAANETVMLGLRTRSGLDLGRYKREFGADAGQHLDKNIASLKREGLLEVREGRLRLTKRGILLANEAVTRLCL